jgi:succinoglycan biosynthesis protein ExoH
MWGEVWEEVRTRITPHVSAVPAEHLSRTIEISRIALIVGLVFLHYGMYPNIRISPFGGMSVDEFEVATFINSFLLFFFFSVVPLLSLISGWLFFSFADARETPQVALSKRMRSRFRSLYLPLIVWNGLYIGILFSVYVVVPDHPLLDTLNVDFSTAGLRELINAIAAIDHHPVAFQFWFVRDLFLTVLLSPLLWLLLKRVPYLALAALSVVWLVNYDLGIFFRPDVLFFFFLGGFVRTRRINVGISWRATMVLVALYVALVTARAWAPQVVDEPTLMLAAMTRVMRLLGVLACWGFFLRVSRSSIGRSLARWGALAFFLHALHFPLLAEVKLLLWNALPEVNDFWMVIHYLVSVIVTIVIALGIGVMLSVRAPRVFGLLNGGRELGFGTARARTPALGPKMKATLRG